MICQTVLYSSLALQVEEAGVLWVREIPSSNCSEELKNFLKLEVQVNEHFKDKHLQSSQHYSLLRVGSVSADNNHP